MVNKMNYLYDTTSLINQLFQKVPLYIGDRFKGKKSTKEYEVIDKCTAIDSCGNKINIHEFIDLLYGEGLTVLIEISRYFKDYKIVENKKWIEGYDVYKTGYGCNGEYSHSVDGRNIYSYLAKLWLSNKKEIKSTLDGVVNTTYIDSIIVDEHGCYYANLEVNKNYRDIAVTEEDREHVKEYLIKTSRLFNYYNTLAKQHNKTVERNNIPEILEYIE